MIYTFLTDYFSIIIFLIISLFLSIGFILINFLASPSNPDPEKLSAYECGFDAFDDLEWNLMLDFTWLQFYLLSLIWK